eukprot:TRINITY_DN6442_c0_g1_i1.p1 TRINITY_DN6442_c0_g1~~TRINITY_DN6442_c0_g1_i1.p1  ORF type:complete len:732 (+),score=144.42 TRINITY_DN6442_c0_g1_i1:66-2261(+)
MSRHEQPQTSDYHPAPQENDICQWLISLVPERADTITIPLAQSLKDGVTLLMMAEKFAGGSIGRWNQAPRMMIHYVDNARLAIQAFMNMGFPNSGLRPQDIAEGNHKLVLGFLSQIMMSSPTATRIDSTAAELEKQVLLWLGDVIPSFTEYYAQSFSIEECTKDGILFCQLLVLLDPTFEVEHLMVVDPVTRITQAMQYALRVYRIPSSLSPDDVFHKTLEKEDLVKYINLYRIESQRRSKRRTINSAPTNVMERGSLSLANSSSGNFSRSTNSIHQIQSQSQPKSAPNGGQVGSDYPQSNDSNSQGELKGNTRQAPKLTSKAIINSTMSLDSVSNVEFQEPEWNDAVDRIRQFLKRRISGDFIGIPLDAVPRLDRFDLAPYLTNDQNQPWWFALSNTNPGALEFPTGQSTSTDFPLLASQDGQTQIDSSGLDAGESVPQRTQSRDISLAMLESINHQPGHIVGEFNGSNEVQEPDWAPLSKEIDAIHDCFSTVERLVISMETTIDAIEDIRNQQPLAHLPRIPQLLLMTLSEFERIEYEWKLLESELSSRSFFAESVEMAHQSNLGRLSSSDMEILRSRYGMLFGKIMSLSYLLRLEEEQTPLLSQLEEMKRQHHLDIAEARSLEFRFHKVLHGGPSAPSSSSHQGHDLKQAFLEQSTNELISLNLEIQRYLIHLNHEWDLWKESNHLWRNHHEKLETSVGHLLQPPDMSPDELLQEITAIYSFVTDHGL